MKKSFSSKCYETIREVPRGKVVTYKQVAERLGTKAYRAIGNSMHNNPHAPLVPCHRVIKNNGYIGGYSKGMKKKKELLIKEGIEIKKIS
ncbi:MAG: MGMT family protein [Nanoarchaeota archaeon]|nr:MGMT family protein [Nanoarchaeota archaeon]